MRVVSLKLPMKYTIITHVNRVSTECVHRIRNIDWKFLFVGSQIIIDLIFFIFIKAGSKAKN